MVRPLPGAAAVLIPPLLLFGGGGATGCAGAGTSAPGPDVGPGAELAERLRVLNRELETDVNGVTNLYAPLAERVAGLPALPATVARGDLHPDILRTGLQACFTAPGQGPCNTAEVTRLLDWAASMGPAMQAMVDDKVAHLSFLRTALEIVIERAPALVYRVAEDRVQVQRIIIDGYASVEGTEENPLEAARVKDAARASFVQIMKGKDEFEAIQTRIEREVRPLADRALVLPQQVITDLQRFGDAR